MTTEDWLKHQMSEYDKNPEQTLEDMLVRTTDVIEQFINNPESKATKGLLDICFRHNKLFLEQIEDF
jgi:hypothetical protein